MPELPEVETVRRGLAPALEGAVLEQVFQNRPDLRFPLPERFVERLQGARVDRLDRRAKYLLARLDRGETLLMHLGMTGRFSIEAAEGASRPGDFVYAPPADPRHDHVVFLTSAGARIAFNDPRRFGFMTLFDTAREAEAPALAGLGPEPLSNRFSGAYLSAALEGRRTPIKAALLDQKIIAGLGNIYVIEALHRAGVSPRRLARTIPGARAERLAVAIRNVIAEAIEAGGSTLRDFASTDGALGYFQHTFRAYGREGEACPSVNCDGRIARIVQSGRSTFFCGRCQR